MEPVVTLLPTRRDRLRQATSSIHRRIDAHIVSWGCLASHERYNAYLVATLRARAPLEASLDQSHAERVFPPWRSRRLAAILREDLLDLSLTQVLDPPAGSFAPLLDPPAILGALYVLEGSALGAQILKRRAAAIGLTACHGAGHLDRQTAAPRTWSAFLECLEAYDLTSDGDEQCVQSAVATFEAFDLAYQAMT